MIGRRAVIAGLPLALGGLAACSGAGKVGKAVDFAKTMLDIQKRHGGRIGVSALKSAGGTNASLSLQSSDRFAMCSTFKWVLAAAILQQADLGKLSVFQEVKYTKADLLEYAPVMTMHVDEGKMTVGDLCAAAVGLSDNTAANLLLPLIGGPAGLTAFMRATGDSVTRLDRTEPELNSNIAGDERDTTTPAAMAGLLRTVFTGAVLKPESLKLLTDWMVAATTGTTMIRASAPKGWIVGDKTGRGNGAVNDVAVLWPPKSGDKPSEPIFLAIYTSGGTLGDDARAAIVAEIARVVLDILA